MSYNLPPGCTDDDISRAWGDDFPDEDRLREEHEEMVLATQAEEQYNSWLASQLATEDHRAALACVGRTPETNRRPPQGVKSLNIKERGA